MLFSKDAVRDNIRNRDGKRVFYLAKGDQLTSEARDYLTRERIEILPAETAKPERYRLLSGGFLEEKPEHMTHLYGDVLVEKTHPRIAFRGAMDTLEAEILLCQLELPDLQAPLNDLLQLARNLLRWEVMGEPAREMTLGGLDAAALRRRSHRPQDFYGQPHFMPEVADGEEILWLNRCRCVCRAAELAAVEAFSDREGNPARTDILQALNRMSSMLYILMIAQKAGK